MAQKGNARAFSSDSTKESTREWPLGVHLQQFRCHGPAQQVYGQSLTLQEIHQTIDKINQELKEIGSEMGLKPVRRGRQQVVLHIYSFKWTEAQERVKSKSNTTLQESDRVHAIKLPLGLELYRGQILELGVLLDYLKKLGLNPNSHNTALAMFNSIIKSYGFKGYAEALIKTHQTKLLKVPRRSLIFKEVRIEGYQRI